MEFKYAKAYAAALVVLITFVVAQFGLDLPEAVTGALIVILTPSVVAAVPNKKDPPPTQARILS